MLAYSLHDPNKRIILFTEPLINKESGKIIGMLFWECDLEYTMKNSIIP